MPYRHSGRDGRKFANRTGAIPSIEVSRLRRSVGFTQGGVCRRQPPQMVDGFTQKTFIAMVEGVKDLAISRGLIQKEQWHQGINDLKRSARPQGTFSYTFFKAVGKKSG